MSLFNSLIFVGRIFNIPKIEIIQGNFGPRNKCTLTLTTVKINPHTGLKDYLYIDCTFWQADADKAVKTLNKGSVIIVQGELKQNRWEDKNTKEKRSKYVLDVREWQSLDEIMALLPSANGQAPLEQKPQPKQYTPSQSKSSFQDGPPLQEPPMDEELPF